MFVYWLMVPYWINIYLLGVIDKCIVSIDNIDNKENSLTRKGIDGYDVLW